MSIRRGLPALAALLILVALLVASCGGSSSSGGSQTSTGVDPNAAEVSPAGDIPDNQVFVPYRAPGTDFSVKVPEGWARATASGAVTFSDKLNSIRIQQRQAGSAPTPAQVKASAAGLRGVQVDTVQRKAGEAIRVKYLAAAKRDPVTGKQGTDAVERYLFFHNGRVAELTLSGPKGADNVDPWRIVSDSLRWVA
ncbi:MAG: hypothetical protein QOK00_1290 [Thermoleophilaceae bacterium]|jgi:hypothetical protein|nr:hypothetical protein [Thermoleophilaceae bacterium]